MSTIRNFSFSDASDRTRMLVSLAFCFAVSLVVALVLTGATLAHDAHSCHTEGGHYTLTLTTGTCSWAPEAGDL